MLVILLVVVLLLLLLLLMWNKVTRCLQGPTWISRVGKRRQRRQITVIPRRAAADKPRRPQRAHRWDAYGTRPRRRCWRVLVRRPQGHFLVRRVWVSRRFCSWDDRGDLGTQLGAEVSVKCVSGRAQLDATSDPWLDDSKRCRCGLRGGGTRNQVGSSWPSREDWSGAIEAAFVSWNKQKKERETKAIKRKASEIEIK